MGWDNRPTAVDREGQGCVYDHLHTFLLRRDNILSICVTLQFFIVPPLKIPSSFCSTLLTAKALWLLGGINICLVNTFLLPPHAFFKTFQCQRFLHGQWWVLFLFLTLMWAKSAYLLSETSTMDLGDGIWSHWTPNARAGRRSLGYWGDAIWRVLTGWRKGSITGHTQTILCVNSMREIKIRNNNRNKTFVTTVLTS